MNPMQAQRRIQNAIRNLSQDMKGGFMLQNLAKMYIEAEVLLSAIAVLYNEAHDANNNAGIINMRIDRKKRPGRLPKSTEVQS